VPLFVVVVRGRKIGGGGVRELVGGGRRDPSPLLVGGAVHHHHRAPWRRPPSTRSRCASWTAEPAASNSPPPPSSRAATPSPPPPPSSPLPLCVHPPPPARRQGRVRVAAPRGRLLRRLPRHQRPLLPPHQRRSPRSGNEGRGWREEWKREGRGWRERERLACGGVRRDMWGEGTSWWHRTTKYPRRFQSNLAGSIKITPCVFRPIRRR
jgi:hypothetical protein